MITVTSLTPGKNSTGVSINQDIEIRVSADFKLDPRNVSFKLNELDVVPNVFSIYNGATEYDLVITLYARKRIKFGDEYRYGQSNIRYGMRDIYPSVLEYGSRYVCSFLIWGSNDLGQREETADSFVFSTEEGIFYNSKPATYFYSDQTQSMANKLPEWSRARFDKYSNFQQLLNPIGEYLEKSQTLADKIYQGSLIQTVDLKELPFLYKYELDKNFEFQNFFNQDGSTFFIQPEISGIQGITRFDLLTTEDNGLKSLYQDKTPTRINTKQIYVGDNVVVPETVITNLLFPVYKKLEREGSFVLYCTNISTSILRKSPTTIAFLKCQVKGISIFDKKQEEEIVLYNEKYLFTKKLWKKIETVQFFNVEKTDATFKLLHFPESDKMSPDMKRMILPSGNADAIIWSFENRDNTIIQKRRTLGESGIQVLKNAGETEIISEMAMFDINNSTPLQLTDIAVDYTSNKIYGVDNNYLYIFDKREPYPETLKKIPGDNGASDLVLSIIQDGTSLNENGQKEIQVNCIHTTPGKKIIKYRIKITKPDNSVVYLLRDSSVTSDPNNSSVYVKQLKFTLENISNRFTADMVGEYLFELEVMYQGGTVSKDYAFVYLPKISAIVKYKLERILNDSIPVMLFLDFDQELKIYTDKSMLHSIVFHKDGILIDYVNKVLYSSEEYTSIDVE